MFLYLRLFFAFLFAAALVAYPVNALAGAQAGLNSWACSVAPAMLPFIAVMPYLTCDEARAVYNKLFGHVVKKLFQLPGEAAAALVIGMIAGSPAGAMAVVRVASAEKMSRGQAARLAGMCCGVSPVYALSVMGVSLTGSERIGWCFVVSQIVSSIAVGVLFRGAFGSDDMQVSAVDNNDKDKPIMEAVLAVLRVGGYMTVFSAGMCMAFEIVGEKIVLLSPFIDLPTGLNYIFASDMDVRIAAAALGFGGLCIAVQNLGVLKSIGVKPLYYFVQKAAGAMVCCIVFSLLMKLEFAQETLSYGEKGDIFDINILFFVLISVPVTLEFLRKSSKKLFS